jgi:ferritin-like metal-binding protein YciE
MKVETLRDFYVEELKDLYNAESQLIKALPKMVEAATSPELKRAFEDHFEETRGHVDRLEIIFKGLDKSPSGKHCKAMEGLLAEGDEVLKCDWPDAVKDAALIAAAQRVEHYEMAGYGCARTYARLLGEDDAATLLDETLQEEGAADAHLTVIAEGSVNEEATMEEEAV